MGVAGIDGTKEPREGGIANLNSSMNGLGRDGDVLNGNVGIVLHNSNTSRVANDWELDETTESKDISHGFMIFHASF